MLLDTLWINLLYGLLMGGIYVIIAQSLGLLWGTMGVVNFAHGDLLMLGCYTAYWMYSLYGFNEFMSAPIAFLTLTLFGGVVYFLLIKPLLGSTTFGTSTRIMMYGASLVIANVARLVWTANYKIMPPSLPSLSIGSSLMASSRLIAFFGAIVLTVVLYLILKKSYFGKATRAIANNLTAALLMGIDPAFIYWIGFMLAWGITGVAGSLIATVFPIYPDMGVDFQTSSFLVVILGGLGNFAGIAIGGLSLGLMEGVVGGLFGSSWKPVFGFFLILLVLMLKRRQRE